MFLTNLATGIKKELMQKYTHKILQAGERVIQLKLELKLATKMLIHSTTAIITKETAFQQVQLIEG